MKRTQKDKKILCYRLETNPLYIPGQNRKSTLSSHGYKLLSKQIRIDEWTGSV